MSMLIRTSWSASAVAATLALTSVLGGTAPAGTLQPYSHPIRGLGVSIKSRIRAIPTLYGSRTRATSALHGSNDLGSG